MKNILLGLLLFTCSLLFGQVNYPKQNIELISHLTPNFGVGGIDGRLYAGCWGWFQADKRREYAISGASNGTYFIDVTVPASPTVCAYVAGKLGCTWREEKTYKNFCYIVSDDQTNNRFQIVDMQYLPDSVHVVYDGTEYFQRAHTLFIDQDKLYVGSVTEANGYSAMNIYSLATPTAPALLRKLAQDISGNVIEVVHDMYVRNDTIYASCGYGGLYILRYDPAGNSISQLGSYTGYNSVGYNHSSWLTRDGKHLIFCDEVPAGLPIHYIDVQNFNNIQPSQVFRPYPATTPHNPYIIGNDFALVSCYQDGLMIYDLSQPGNVMVAGYFDTHPQGGYNVDNYFGADYRGNWGAYPYLPSGIIIAQDMQNGVFILDATAAFAQRVGLKEQNPGDDNLLVYPNPANDQLTIKYNSNSISSLSIKNMLGQSLFEKTTSETVVNEQLDLRPFESGTYILSHRYKDQTGNSYEKNQKLIITH